MATTMRTLTCRACGKTRLASSVSKCCRTCGGYISTWGKDGFVALKSIASKQYITYHDMTSFLVQFHPTISDAESITHPQASTFRRAVKSLGFTGTFERKNARTLNRNIARRQAASLPRICTKCQVTENLNAHHIIPIDWGGDPHSIDNITILCESCHKKEHARISAAIRKKYISVSAFRNLLLKDHIDEIRQVILPKCTQGKLL